MKKLLLLMIVAIMALTAQAQEVKPIELATYDCDYFSISYPAEWEATSYFAENVNVSNRDHGFGELAVTYNDDGPNISQLKETADNIKFMCESQGAHCDSQPVISGKVLTLRTMEKCDIYDDATGMDVEKDVVAMQFVVMKKDKVCLVGFFKYVESEEDIYAPCFDAILKSVVIK